MHFHSNLSAIAFLDWLRDAGIKNNMPPQFIDCVDKLYELDGRDAELEKMGDDLYELEKVRDDLNEELESLVRTVDENLDRADNRKPIENALKMALAAIDRHSKP